MIFRNFLHISIAAMAGYCCSNHCSKQVTKFQLLPMWKKSQFVIAGSIISPVCEVLFSFLFTASLNSWLLTAEEWNQCFLQLFCWSAEVPILKALAITISLPKVLLHKHFVYKCSSVTPLQPSTRAHVLYAWQMCAWGYLCSAEYINVCVRFGWYDETYECRIFYSVLHKEFYSVLSVVCRLVCLCVFNTVPAVCTGIRLKFYRETWII